MDTIRDLEAKAGEYRQERENGVKIDGTELMESLEKAYMDFAEAYPEAPETPEFIFRAAELNGNDLGRIGRSIQLYERIARDYPKSPNAATALFLAGYTYHNTLHDLIRAEKAFKDFIQRYPDHELVQAAEYELSTLGKPVKEILDQLIRSDSVGYSFLKDH